MNKEEVEKIKSDVYYLKNHNKNLTKEQKLIENELNCFLKKLQPYNLEGIRTCSYCGRPMDKGYCIEQGAEYYCCRKCLNKEITDDEFNKLYDNGKGDSYYTEWDSYFFEE